MTPARFAGRVAVVTGAGSGIGAAAARRFAADGADVVVSDVDDAAGEACVEGIRSMGGRAEFVHLDAADEGDWKRVGVHVTKRYGRLDVLHSNAARVVLAPAHELDTADWDSQLAVTVRGAFLGARTFIPLLSEFQGAIVLTSSVHALFGLPGHPAYAAAKGALGALGRQLAVEYGPQVRVNTVLPGPIKTAMWDRVAPREQQASAAATVAGRLGDPDEVAAAVAFLASSDASYITGASLVVDGGWSIVKDSA